MAILSEPVWLILILPVLAAAMAWPPSGRLLRVLSLLTVASLILALCQPLVRLPSRNGTVVVVADRSLSMPATGLTEQSRWVGLLRKGMEAGDQLAVVAFGHDAVVEAPPGSGEFAGFQHDLDTGQSSLASGLEMALSLIPDDGNGRVVVFSDGLWTGANPHAVATTLASRGVGLDFRVQSRAKADDVAIERIAVPATVHRKQSFLISAWVRSPAAKQATYELLRNGVPHARGEIELPAGTRRLFFRDTAPAVGSLRYELMINAGEDPVPENNHARVLVGVSGAKPILHLAPTAGSALGELLRGGGLEVRTRKADGTGFSLAELAGYDAIVLENVTASSVGASSLGNLAAWVRETGAGLMTTGGRNSYGPGGYFRSALDPLLPVSMELRREHRKLRLAIVVALDRSGSMGAPAGGGKTKMDLANLGTAQILDLLGENDELGVLAVDSAPHEIVDLCDVSAARAHRGRILGIGSQGGGIFVYEALKAATRMLMTAKAGTRHIVLFADAADAEQPGQYVQLVEKCRDAGITISVVGLGTEGDSDANLLKDIAKRGDGRCLFTADAKEIPRLFAQDTFAVARSTFIGDPTEVAATGEMATLFEQPLGQPPALGGFNLCYARPKASVAMRTVDEYEAPVVAYWQAGLGRALCFTGEADGKAAGEFAKWSKVGAFYTGLTRWVAGNRDQLPDQMVVTQQLREGACVIELHLDPERQGQPFVVPPTVRLLRGSATRIPTSETVHLQWRDADTLSARVLLRGEETVLPTLLLAGEPPHSLSPACLPYSPEFRRIEPGKGRKTMTRLAALTGGHECLDLSEIWEELPRRPGEVPLSPWLYSLALVCFLLGILHRRTGLLANLPSLRLRRRPAKEPSARRWRFPRLRLPRWRRRRPPPVPTSEPEPSEPTPPAAPPDAVEDEHEATLDAMRAARRRAGRRTRRD
jgi:Mg-chelatase subunit ChlD